MRLTLGNDFFAAKDGKVTPVQIDTEKLINGHILIVGSSGVGKSYTIRRLIADAGKKVRFHVFDVHGDLEIQGASTVRFSEQAPFGLNPLRVNPDPDFGGVRKCIQTFIRTVNFASATGLGVKQEAVIRNLLIDVFKEFGFHPDDPSTWGVNEFESTLISGGGDNRLYLEVPIAEKDEAKANGARWDPDRKLWWIRSDLYKGKITHWKPAFKARRYPSVADVLAYAKRLHVERFMGSDQQAVRALMVFNRKAKAFQRKFLESVKKNRADEVPSEIGEGMEEAKIEALDAYTKYVNSVSTGVELESLMKYDSSDVLKSVVDRLGNLVATGIFKDVHPPFEEEKPVWRYQLNALSQEEKKMLVLFMLQDIFSAAMQRGQTSDVVEVVVLDELGTYTSSQDDDSGDGIIGVIAREARKFGLALWAANQSPANVPESLISSVAVKLVLGLDEMYWQSAVTKLRLETKLLEWIRPHHTLAVQMKEKGALKNRWWWVKIHG